MGLLDLPLTKNCVRFSAFPKYIYCRFLLIGYKRRSLGKGYGITYGAIGNILRT
jgi:hypothetical protein